MRVYETRREVKGLRNALPFGRLPCHHAPVNEAERAAQARVGQTLRDKWRLDSLIGCGGMAAVYAATHRNGKRAAVKVLHAQWCGVEDVRQRFLREGYVANKVGHPGAVSVLDDDTAEDGSVFLVMELLDGATVDACAASRPGKRLAVEEAVGVTEQLLEVLAAAHDQGIVHRDIKPENLFVTRNFELKVLDFGIARLREGEPSQQTTAHGSFLGTPAFMAPEQASGRWAEVDARTDLWAVGATLYTLLTGAAVHDAETLPMLIAAAITKPAPKIQARCPELPAALSAVVDRALAFEASARFASAREMLSALRAATASDSVEAPRASLNTLVSLHFSSAAALSPQRLPSSHLAAPSEPLTTARAVSSRTVPVPAPRSPLLVGLAAVGLVALGAAGVYAVQGSSFVGAEGAPSAAAPAAMPPEAAPLATPPATPPASAPRVEPAAQAVSSSAASAAVSAPVAPSPAPARTEKAPLPTSTPAKASAAPPSTSPKPRHDDGF